MSFLHPREVGDSPPLIDVKKKIAIFTTCEKKFAGLYKLPSTLTAFFVTATVAAVDVVVVASSDLYVSLYG